MSQDTFKSTAGHEIPFYSPNDQLKIEYILQRHREVWVIIPDYPYIAIDWNRVQALMPALKSFVVFSSGWLLQNMRREDFGARMLGSLIGGGTTAGFGPKSDVQVKGKANAKAWFLLNFNRPLCIGTTPWISAGTQIIAVEEDGLYQHDFANLIEVNKRSRPNSTHFNFTMLCDLRDEYITKYLSNRELCPNDISKLAELLDCVFTENQAALAEADAHHKRVSVGMVSNDYEPPVLTKYERLTHDTNGRPCVEVAFALLHYERAIQDFNNLKTAQAAGKTDESLSLGVNCVVSAAATIEAIANRLVFEATGTHPDHKDKRQSVQKIHDSGTILATRSGGTFSTVSTSPYLLALDELRQLRNDFMHAKEKETDIDPATSASELLNKVNEANCRRFLASIRQCADIIFSQLPMIASPIVTKSNTVWMGDLEVP